jgi:hypothetical protein
MAYVGLSFSLTYTQAILNYPHRAGQSQKGFFIGYFFIDSSNEYWKPEQLEA